MVFATSNRVGLLHPTPDRDSPRFKNKSAKVYETPWLGLNIPAMRVEPLEEFPLLTAASLSPVTVAFLPFVPTLCEQKGTSEDVASTPSSTEVLRAPWEFDFKALLRKQVRNHQRLLPDAVVLSFHGLGSPSRPDRRVLVSKQATTHNRRSGCDTVSKSPGRLPCDSVPERRSRSRLPSFKAKHRNAEQWSSRKKPRFHSLHAETYKFGLRLCETGVHEFSQRTEESHGPSWGL